MGVSLDGSTQYLTGGPEWNGPTGTFTVFFMVFPVHSSGSDVVFGRRQGFNTAGFLIQFPTAGGNAIRLVTRDGAANTHNSSTGAWTINTWTRCVVRSDNVDVFFYANGSAFSSTTFTPATAVPGSTNTLPYGVDVRNASSFSGFWSGDLGPLALWDEDLGADAALALSNGVSPLIVSPGNLLNFWPLYNVNYMQDLGPTPDAFSTVASPTTVSCPALIGPRRSQRLYIPPPAAAVAGGGTPIHYFRRRRAA